MEHGTISEKAQERFVEVVKAQAERMGQQLSQWAAGGQHTVAEMEQATLQGLHELGRVVLGELCGLYQPAYAEPEIACRCGGQADYQRWREGQMQTLLGDIGVRRAYYLCGQCHHGQCPVDQQLGFCAGGQSAGLREVMALLGAQFSFEEAAELVARLTLVQVSPTACQQQTEALGQCIAQAEAKAVQQAWDIKQPQLPPPPAHPPQRLYLSMDGVIVHVGKEVWREMKLAAVYTTTSRPPPKQPDQLQIRVQDPSYIAEIAEPAEFGRLLYVEACRRGVTQAQEVVVIGDGAHWIWRLAQEHFPNATQIVDWYHTTPYVWRAAEAIYGCESDLAKQWAKQRLDELWQGQVGQVLAQCQAHTEGGQAVSEAISFFTNNQSRMRYPEYRARGLQVGSGCIESGCKHVIAQRLKQSGMLWSLDGARFVAKVRSRFKSHRWQESWALYPPPHRSYTRKAA